MTDLITAMVYTIRKYVAMLFSLQIDNGVSIGAFFLAVAIMGALIKLLFSLIHIPGRKNESMPNVPYTDRPRIEQKG